MPLDLKSLVVSQLSLYAWREGRRIAPGSQLAMLGVAFVLANRQKAGHWDSDWLKVIQNAPAHCSSEKSEMDFVSLPDPWAPDWRWLTDKVDRLYDQELKDDLTWAATTPNSGGINPQDKIIKNNPRCAYFYGNLSQPIRNWFLTKIIQDPTNHPRVSEIQPVTFFG